MTTSLIANKDIITKVPQDSKHSPTLNIKQDIKKQDSINKDKLNTSLIKVLKDLKSGFKDNSKVSKLSLLALF